MRAHIANEAETKGRSLPPCARRRRLIVGALCVSALIGPPALWAGCGTGTPAEGSLGIASVAPAPYVPAFVDLARAVGPMPVYGLNELPAGVTVAADWWPVVDVEDPSQYGGPAVANPRVSGELGTEPEAQLVLEHPDGWIVVLENFRGDLGDVAGENVGEIGGNVAALYEVNGGILVQWSDGGRWYGVLARGMPAESVVEISLKMGVIDGDVPE